MSTGGGGASRLEQPGTGARGVVDGWFTAAAGSAGTAKKTGSRMKTNTWSDRNDALCTLAGYLAGPCLPHGWYGESVVPVLR